MSDTRRAVRFFWTCLALAAGASVTGNITHAMLAEPQHAVIAAAAAVVPPAVFLGATHGVALLVRTRIVGVTYWCALAMTAMLAGCAFVLSFDSLYALAADWAGYRRGVAWLWPLSIDLSIAVSTLAILALTGAPRRKDNAPVVQSNPPVVQSNAPTAHNGAPVAHTNAPMHQLADEMIGAGVTRIERDKLAAVLGELEDGTALSTIARKVGVGYSTVARIAENKRTGEY